MPRPFNRVQMTTATTGTGTLTLGAASTNYQSFAAASVPNATVVSYVIEEGSTWEVGTGTYTVAGTTLSRTLVASSSGSLISLAGAAVVFISPLADDLFPLGDKFTVLNVTGSYTFPTTGNIPKALEVLVFGGGAGGASGRRGAAATARSGGANGGAGGVSRRIIPAAQVPAGAITVTVGAGGSGGAAVAVDSTNGNPSTGGGFSLFGSLVRASGGVNAGGAGAIGYSAGVPGDGTETTPQGSATIVTAAQNQAVIGSRGIAPGHGGNGGCISTGDVAFTGQRANSNMCYLQSTAAAGGAVGAAGTAGIAEDASSLIGAGGGGGGGASTVAAGGDGGAGAVPGGSGGGGGASLNGFASGAGGAGAAGRVIVIERFGA